jgi:predicted dehydrogenase
VAKLRAGIIGGGMIAAVHANALRHAGIRVAGAAGSSRERSELFAHRLLAETAFATPEDLIASPDVDVVHICTPNASHARYARLVLAAGKSVICEKPLGVNLDEARMLADYAAKVSGQTAVPFVYRYYPLVREMREHIVGNGQPVMLIRGSYLQDWLADPGSTNWRVNDADGGASRAFADIGVHVCDLIEFTTGQRISRLAANVSTAYRQRQDVEVRTEDIATIMFETDGGTPGVATVSQVSNGYKNRLTLSVDAADASYSFDQESPDSLIIGTRDSTTVVPRSETSLRNEDARRLSVLPSGHPQGYQDSFNAFIRDAYQSFAGETVRGLPTFTDGLRAAVITDAVLRSVEARAWVAVDEARDSTQGRLEDLTV